MFLLGKIFTSKFSAIITDEEEVNIPELIFRDSSKIDWDKTNTRKNETRARGLEA